MLVDSDVKDGLERNQKEKKKKKLHWLIVAIIFIPEQAFPSQTFPLATELFGRLVREIVERILKQISHGAPAGRIEDPGIGTYVRLSEPSPNGSVQQRTVAC